MKENILTNSGDNDNQHNMPARNKKEMRKDENRRKLRKTALFNGANKQKPMKMFNMISFLNLLLAVRFRVYYYTSSDGLNVRYYSTLRHVKFVIKTNQWSNIAVCTQPLRA